MNRCDKTAVTRQPGAWLTVPEMAEGRRQAFQAGVSARTPLPNRKPLVQALGSAMLLVAAATPAAQAQSVLTGPYNWTSGNLTVGTGGAYLGISGLTGVNASGSIGTLSNSGTISGTTADGIDNTGTIATLNNTSTGTISGSRYGIYNHGGTISTLTNSGAISGGHFGMTNSGTIETLTNSGTISGARTDGISNTGTIATLINSGAIVSGLVGIWNLQSIDTLTNSGTISSTNTGMVNYGNIGTLINSGTISGNNAYYGIYNANAISTLSNAGLIAGGAYGIINSGSIGSLSNSGTITGSVAALDLTSGSTLNSFSNTGVIAGGIINNSSGVLTIDGGSGTRFGTLTGASGSIGASAMGSITSGTDLIFNSGNQLLNDDINVNSGTVTNAAGVLQINNQIAVTGNYSQNANATLQIGVGNGATTTGAINDSGYGRLVVSGAATVASGSSVSLTGTGAGYRFAAGQRFLVIQGGTGSSYGGVTTQAGVSTLNYSIANYTSSITGNAVTDGAGLDLVLTLDSAAPIPRTGASTAPNAIAGIGALAGYAGFNSQLMNLQNAMYAANSGASAADSNRIGKQLGPSGGAGSAAASTTMASLDEVGARMGGGTGPGGYASTDGGGLGTGIATGEASRDWTAWGQAFGGRANQSQRDQVDGYSASYAGLLLGIDKDLNAHWRTGGAFSYSNTYVSNNGDTSGNSAHVNAYGLIGYARYQGDPWYVNLSATAALQQYGTSRAITSIPGFASTANGKFNGMQYAARAEAGYPIRFNNDVVLTPIGSLTYSYQNQNAYTESGGNGAALSVGATHANSVKSGLGVRLEKAYSTRYGQAVPFIQAQWIHEYDTTQQATTAGFSIDPSSTAFTTYGASPIANMADVALGVKLVKTDNVSLSAQYEVQVASGYFAQTGLIKLQMRF